MTMIKNVMKTAQLNLSSNIIYRNSVLRVMNAVVARKKLQQQESRPLPSFPLSCAFYFVAIKEMIMATFLRQLTFLPLVSRLIVICLMSSLLLSITSQQQVLMAITRLFLEVRTCKHNSGSCTMMNKFRQQTSPRITLW